jgi:hypothetical protein
MIVAQRDIDLVLNPRLRRRMMRLPVHPKVPCPVRLGKPYGLQPRPFVKAQVRITVIQLRREALQALSLADARREGYASPAGALDAYRRANGPSADDQQVWVVSFVRGEEDEFMAQDTPVYLARFGDFTTREGRQAVPGDPEYCPVSSDRVEAARVMALASRSLPARRAITRAEGEVATLREAMTTMRARNRAKLIERELGKLTVEVTQRPIAM